MQKNRPTMTKLTQDQFARLKVRAEAKGLSVSAYVRMLVCNDLNGANGQQSRGDPDN